MKLIFTLMAFVISSSLQAQRNVQLTISSAERISYITINGKKHNVHGNDNELNIGSLSAGRYQIKIYAKDRGRGNGRFQTAKIIYQGIVHLRNGYHTDVYVNRFGKAFTDDEGVGRNTRFGFGSNGMGLPMISHSGFLSLKSAIKDASFDQTKVAVAKQSLSNNSFSTAQVKEVLELIVFESSKLDLAKSYYENVEDPENYLEVSKVFAFNSSKEELAEFISGF